MITEHLIVFSVPGLRPGDINRDATPTLHAWANQGVLAELTPTFPCVTSPVQASMWCGTPPREHGVIGNGFYHRERSEVEFWVARNDVIAGEQVWDAMSQRRPQCTSAIWHAQNIKGAAADYIVTPAPIHNDDGSTDLWCYSKPDGLYAELIDELGHFPLQHYWGPLANIESTRWILKGASWLIEKHQPNLHWVYLPHLDYAAQKFGPNSAEAMVSLAELDHELRTFSETLMESRLENKVAFLVTGEYALTEVSESIYPNRLLRDAGLLAIRKANDHEYIDLKNCQAFAVVDHQFAHVYVNPADAQTIAKVVDVLRQAPGIDGVFAGEDRKQVGLDHPRSGEIVILADPARWFTYYWWLHDDAAPPFARTVDIHNKPGYDPVELFFDPVTKSIPIDTSLVKGSHGVPATQRKHQTAMICSMSSTAIESGQFYRDTDVKRITLDLLGIV
jgi:predicted AlkP superfamily pyrophosphatase or phosphodiesterase